MLTSNLVFIAFNLFFLFWAIVFSLASQSFSNLNSKEIKWLKRKKADINATLILKMFHTPRELIASMEFGKTVSILGLLYSGNLVLLSVTQNLKLEDIYIVIAAIGIIAIVYIAIFLVPKIYAENHSLLVAKSTAPLVVPVFTVIKPIVTWWTSVFKNNEDEAIQTNDKIAKLKNEVSEQEYQMLKRIDSFGNKLAIHVMRPRVEIAALDGELNFDNVKQKIRELNYSRMPVFNNNIDNIIGILYSKDLLPYLDSEDFYWKSLLQEPIYLQANITLGDLLQKFKSTRIHMAIIVDEFGGTMGLITLEDVIEQITGEIHDEYDTDVEKFFKLNDNEFIINPKITIQELNDNLSDFEFSFTSGNNTATLNGLIINTLGRLPKTDEIVYFGSNTIKILTINNNKIEKVKLSLN